MSWFLGIVIVLVALVCLFKFVLFVAPNVVIMNGGATTAVGGSTVHLVATDPVVFDESIHNGQFIIKYADGTKDKTKEGKPWKADVTLRNVPGLASIYALNCCPFTDYASGKSKPLVITITPGPAVTAVTAEEVATICTGPKG